MNIYLVDTRIGAAILWPDPSAYSFAYAERGIYGPGIVSMRLLRDGRPIDPVGSEEFKQRLQRSYFFTPVTLGAVGTPRPISEKTVDALVGPAYRRALVTYFKGYGHEYLCYNAPDRLLISPDGRSAVVQGIVQLLPPDWAPRVGFCYAYLLLPNGKQRVFKDTEDKMIRFLNWSRDGRFLFGQRGGDSHQESLREFPLVALDMKTGIVSTIAMLRRDGSIAEGGGIVLADRFIED